MRIIDICNYLRKKNIFRLVIGIQFLALLAVGIHAYHKTISNNEWKFDMKDLQSSSMIFNEDTGYWEYKGDKDNSSDKGLLNGPNLSMKKGSYTAVIEYETDIDQTMSINSKDNEEFLISSPMTLYADHNTAEYSFELKHNVKYFQFWIEYDYGSNYFTVKNITVFENANAISRAFVVLLIVFLLMDLCIIKCNWIAENSSIVIGIMIALTASSVPLFLNGFFIGHDLECHFARIEGVYCEIKNGNFPVYMDSSFFGGKGYPMSIFYNNILIYIPAFLRIAGFTVTQAYKAYIFVVNLGTVIISYVCFGKILKDNDLALISSIAYTLSIYRIIDLYIRAAVGEYTALMFIPFIAVALWKMYIEKPGNTKAIDWKYISEISLYMIAGMSGLIATHVLSFIMVCMLLAFICIIGIKVTFRKNNLLIYIGSAAITVFLNLYYLIPMLDYMLNEHINVKTSVGHGTAKIQAWGNSLADYLTEPSASINGTLNYFEILKPSMGLIMVGIVILSIFLFYKGLLSHESKVLLILILLLMFIASKYFPWDTLTIHSRIINSLAQIQYPWRLLGEASLACSLLIGFLFKDMNLLKKSKECGNIQINLFSVTIVLLMVFSCIELERDFILCSEPINYLYTYDVNFNEVAFGEYLLTGSSPQLVSNSIVCEKGGFGEIVWEKGTDMELNCTSDNDESVISVPRMNYKDYHVYDKDGNELNIIQNGDQTVAFSLPNGYSGMVYVKYVVPTIWNIAYLLSAVGWILLAIYQIYRHAKANIVKESDTVISEAQ